MGDESEWNKLPTDEKVQHKVWKARVAGYEEAIKLFNKLDDDKHPEFSKYLGLVKKMTIDSNAIAQEKGLEAVLAFVENAHVAAKTTSEVCSGVVTKCLNASRAKTKERGMDILMMYIEIERQEVVQEELMKGLGNKQPKVVSGCVVALRTALRDFGHKIFQLKLIVKQLQKLLEDRDKTVREETKLLVVEIYRWIGAAFMPQLSNLKPVQLTELQTEFDKVKEEGKPVQSRFLRSQQDLKEKLEQQAANAGDEGDGDNDDDDEPDADMDPYELMDPVNILAKLPKDFYEKIEAKKWQERREVLEALQKLSENPKLEQGDYHDVLKCVKKIVAKDSNVMLVAIAAKCLEGIAVGLRKKFSPHALGCIDVILDKFKEKKAAVVAALKGAIDAIFQTTTLEVISERCVEALESKNPQIKSESAAFLTRCFQQATPTTLPKKLLKLFVSSLLKLCDFNSGDVRENAYQALGTAMKVVGEKPMNPFISDIENLKQTKIKEYMEKAELVHKSKAKGVTTKPPAVSADKAPPGKVVKGGGPSKKAPDTSASTTTAAASKKVVGGAARPGAKKPASSKTKKPVAASKDEEERILSDESVEEKIATVLPADVITGLASSNWKERLAAMEKFTEVIKGLTKADIPTQACLRTLTKKPGLKETNFQVMKLKVDLVAHLASNTSFSRTTAAFCLLELVEKVADVKNGAGAKEAISCIAEACSLEFTSHKVIEMASSQKNPKSQAECINWLTQALREFGFKVNVKPMIGFIKKSFGATNPAVRTAAIGLLATLYIYMGATLRVFFEGEKAALLQQIDNEFEKVKGEKPPTPTRGLIASEESVSDDEDDGGDDENAGPNIADLVPRTDICDQLTEELMAEMADKNWKVRNEALQKVTTILNEAKFITPNIGPLPESIKLRLVDSNKILVKTAQSICQTIATSMGPSVKQHVRIIGPNLLMGCADSKPNVRINSINCLNAWIEQTGLLPWVEAELFSEVLAKENPFLRAELWGWLAQKLPTVKKLPPEIGACVPFLFASLEDRNADVRKNAQECVMPLMIHTGYESMMRKTSKLKPSSKDAVVAILEKSKALLPAKPVKTKPVKQAAAPVKAATAPVHKEPERYDEPEPPSQIAAPSGKPKGKGPLGKKAPPPKKKKEEKEEDTSPPMKVSNGKDQRIKDEKTLKVLKWNFTAPRAEFPDQLRIQMEPTFSRTMVEQFFHADFKMHLKCITTLNGCIESSADATIANLDMILRWFTLRFFDTNTTVLLKCLEYLQALFNMLCAQDYHLLDFEANSFIPYLVNKVGDPKDSVRKHIRSIFKSICKVYPASKMFTLLIDGLKSKNSKQRTECLEELGHLIQSFGISVCQPTPAAALKIIGQQIGDRDNSVRSSALNACVEAYFLVGETIYKYLSHLNDKDTGMLEERIKRSSKNRPPPGAAPQNINPPKRNADDAPPPSKIVAPKRVQNNANENISDTGAPSKLQQSRLARPKPRLGQYKLDVDYDSDSENNYDMPSLIENDIDTEKPLQLPATMRRPPSPMRNLHSSQDAKSAVSLVISNIANDNITNSVQALAQIDELLKDEDKCDLMKAHVDQFLLMCFVQLRMAYNKHMDDLTIPKSDVIRLYKCLLASILSLFQHQAIASHASSHILKDLISYLITILLDKRLQDIDEGIEITRSVNITVVNVVMYSNCTAMMSALLKLLSESVSNESCATNYVDVTMKCIWRMVRKLPTFIDDIDLDRVLMDLHHFLLAHPTNSWKQKQNVTPLRTIKTILHSLTKLKGPAILNHLGSLQGEGSEVESYIRRVLNNGRAAPNTPHGPQALSDRSQLNGSSDASPQVSLRTNKKEMNRKKRLSKTTHELVSEIFKKVGSKENSKQGLNDLYDFKSKYPDADIEPFLKKTSQIFQNYIERGLKIIEKERREESLQSGVPVADNSPPSPAEAEQNSPEYYQERLRMLRARCGLDTKDGVTHSTPSVLGPSAHANVSRTNDKTSSHSAPLGTPLVAPVGSTLGDMPSNGSLGSSTSSLSSGSSAGMFLDIENRNNTNQETSQPASTKTSHANLIELKKRLDRIKSDQLNK